MSTDSVPTPQPRKILVPTDFSPAAEPAVAWAMALSDSLRAQIIFLHVLDLNVGALAGLPASLGKIPAAPPLADRVREEVAGEVEALKAKYPRCDVTLRQGDPADVILVVAEEMKADMIVMGTHGRSGLSLMFFGSVALSVVRRSAIPVLTVRLASEPLGSG